MVKNILEERLFNYRKIITELNYSFNWIKKEKVTHEWIKRLEFEPEKSVNFTAFCTRFGRAQDYLSDKLIKSLVEVVGEETKNAIHDFSIAEREGLLTIPPERMIEARLIRNNITHDYISDINTLTKNAELMIEFTPEFNKMLILFEEFNANLNFQFAPK